MSLCYIPHYYILGAQAFLPSFDIDSFLYYYLTVFVDIAIFVTYKLVYKTKCIKPEEADLFTCLAEIDENKRKYYEKLALKKGDKPEGRWSRIISWIIYNVLSGYLMPHKTCLSIIMYYYLLF